MDDIPIRRNRPVEATNLPGGKDIAYHKVPDLNMQAGNVPLGSPSGYKEPVFSVLDIDGDGNKEVYSIKREICTAAGYSYEVNVYTSLHGERYWLKARSQFSSPPVLTYSSNIEQNAKIYHWMLKKASQLSFSVSGYPFGQSDKLKPYQDAIQDWLRNQGRGFYRGPLNIHEFRVKSPPPLQGTCVVDDGIYKWFSFPKGTMLSSIVGYNKSKDCFFIIYVPYYDLRHS